MNPEENLKNILDLGSDSEEQTQGEIIPRATEITESGELLPEEVNKALRKDYRTVRKNLRALLKKGDAAIDEILEVARSSDSPRAYEVAAQMIKNMSEINKDLMGIHDSVLPKKENITNKTTTNNTLFIGSTKDLQSFIQQQRNILVDSIDEEIEEIEIANELERFSEE